jgi:hypothetical protein
MHLNKVHWKKTRVINSAWVLAKWSTENWMKTCAPAYHSSIRSNYKLLLEYLRWPHGIDWVQHWEFAELDEWQQNCKGSYWVDYRLGRIMNLHMWYICRKDSRIFTIVYCIRILQLSYLSIRHYRKHNFPFVCSSGLCLLNILYNKCCSQWRREKIWYTKKRYTRRGTGEEKT